MATEEQKQLAEIVKATHDRLRRLSKEKGPDAAWDEHVRNRSELERYSQAMYSLSRIWDSNIAKDDESLAKSRIKWIRENCLDYFITSNLYKIKRDREIRLLTSWKGQNASEVVCKYLEEHPKRVRFLDVGSCYNPFDNVAGIDVTAFDLCPATSNVYLGDLLQIEISDKINNIVTVNRTIKQLPKNHYHCVAFSLFLEYIPTSQQRLVCCRKAYDLLTPEGILIIVTPDSQHVGYNAALMKNWHFTLSKIGFFRIKFEKLPHITCMIFRKSINILIPLKWAEEHFKNEIVKFGLEIPQDK